MSRWMTCLAWAALRPCSRGLSTLRANAGPHHRIAALLAKVPDEIFLKPLKGEVVLSAVGIVPGGEQSHDIWMRQGSQRRALAQEALLAQRVIDRGSVVELDRDQVPGAGVIARAIDVGRASNTWWLGL